MPPYEIRASTAIGSRMPVAAVLASLRDRLLSHPRFELTHFTSKGPSKPHGYNGISTTTLARRKTQFQPGHYIVMTWQDVDVGQPNPTQSMSAPVFLPRHFRPSGRQLCAPSPAGQPAMNFCPDLASIRHTHLRRHPAHCLFDFLPIRHRHDPCHSLPPDPGRPGCPLF